MRPQSPSTIVVTVVAALTLGAASAAADLQAPGAWQPACQAPEIAQFRFMEGRWRVRFEHRLSADGPWETTDGEATIEAVAGGCLFLERLATTRQGHRFEAVSLHAFDHGLSRWQRAVTDSEHGSLTLYEGSFESPARAVFTKRLEIRGQAVVLRHVLERQADGSFVWRSERSTDDGQHWDRTGESRYTKR